MRPSHLSTPIILALSVMLVAGASAQVAPNILFIMTDDQSVKGISAYDDTLIQTPNIDRLAKEGMRFNNCFVTNSICTPSRATILTGKYGHTNGTAFLDHEFDGSQQTFPKLLQAAGYHTGVVGKWHLGSEPTGFDYYNVLPGQGDYRDPRFKEKGKPWANGFDGGERYKGYVTDVTADIGLNFLRDRPKDKPFFLAYQEKAPHDLWEHSEKYAHLYEDTELPVPGNFFDDYATRSAALRDETFFKVGGPDLRYSEETGHLEGRERLEAQYQEFVKRFLRCVASIDENIGRVLDYLDAEGLTDNTIVIFTSDQGAFLGEHGLWDKRFMYEESIRMPLLVRFPKHIRPGSVNSDIVTNVDFAETILDYAGLPIPDDMQGRSIKPLLEGNRPEDWPTSMYYHYVEPGAPPPHYGVRTERYKLIYFYGMRQPAWELYDLEKDPDEMNNVYDDPAYAEVAANTKADLRRLGAHYGDTLGPDIP